MAVAGARPTWRIITVAMLMGAGNFALLFIGFKTASPSAASIVIQLGVPITTVLSMFMLGEKVRWRRGLGMALTLAGAVVVMWHPTGMSMSFGLWLVAAAAFAGSLGAVMMKQMEGIKPLQFQAWVGFSSFWPLALLSVFTEQNQWTWPSTPAGASWRPWCSRPSWCRCSATPSITA